MITHEEASDLLAAFVLDAVDRDEHERIEEHLSSCPRCRTEVDAYGEVVAALGHTVALLPHDLWQAISSRLSVADNTNVPAERTHLRMASTDGVASTGQPSRAVHSSRGRLAVAASAAAGAAAVATVLGLSLANADNQMAQLRGAIGEAAHTEVVAALETPGHQMVRLIDPRRRERAEFVLLPSGRGYLVSSKLPVLAPEKTYQLWAVIKGKTISVGLLGRAPHLATFTLAGASRPFKLGVTIENAGGALRPNGPMLASGVA